MARTIDQIKQLIVNAKSNEADLDIYTSTSATALFNLWAYIMAVAIWTLDVLFDKHKVEVETKINSLIPGTIRWYYSSCLAFQYGDILTWLNGKFVYQVPDVGKMIVKRVAIKEVSGQLRIKVAKEASGVPVALDSTELDAFKAYVGLVKFAGTNVSIVSCGVCLVQVRLNLLYDSLLLTSTGALITDGTEVVKNALENYLKGITYGGVVNRTKLIDAIQAVDGVLDVYIEGFWAQEDGASSYDTITTQNFESVAGYYKLDLLTLTANANV